MDGGLSARVTTASQTNPSDWALLELTNEAGRPINVGPLLRALDDGDAQERDDGTVFLPPDVVVGLSVQDGHSLGLPPRIDWPLVLHLPGTVDRPEARVDFHFEGREGRPLLIEHREGALVTVGGDHFRTSPAAYRAIEAMDTYNATAGHPAPQRVMAWGRVAEELPEETRAEPYLTQTRTSEAVAISLQPFVNDRGEADFSPIPGVWTVAAPLGQESETVFQRRIPDGSIQRFQDIFRRRGPRPNLTLGDGWYLSIPSEVLPVLRVMRDLQEEEPAIRLAFLRNPEAVLRERLPEGPDDLISRIFASDDYSDRVQGTTIWRPPVLPWVRKDPEQWLPEERLGIRIGDQYIKIDPTDLADLVQKLDEARSAGRPSVDYNGVSIPATDEAIQAIQQLHGSVTPDRGGADPELEAETEQRDRLILDVAENFEEISFSVDTSSRPRPGHPDYTKAELGLLNSPLPHQGTAIQWLQAHWLKGSSGALLADDMGLGKTFQALAFMAWIRREMDECRIARRPLLVVAPTGLLENWADEHDTHLGGEGLGDLVRAYGSELRSLRQGTGREYESGVPLLDLERLRSAGWVLTTYETFRDYQHSFGKVRFAVAALDETQKAKNPASGISQAMKTIHANFVICMTGTPVENRLADLWNILDIARPGDLGTLKEFSSSFEAQGVEENSLQALKEHLTDAQPSIMLRRMKTDHLTGLPDKVDHFPALDMPAPQRQAYDQLLGEARSGQLEDHGGMLAILGRMRSVSLHPFVHSGEPDEEYIHSSSRLGLTFQILDKVEEAGEKALVFLESREMQGTLAAMIQRRYRTRQPPMIINGAVSGPRRQDRVRRFQSRDGFDVLILSPKAGGVGLTLTAANHVIHLTRWWNPAVEDQCTDRVYRIGQKRPVQIHHPLAIHPALGEGSFDRVLDRLLKRKRQLSQAVLAPVNLSKDEVREIFRDVLSSNGSTGPTVTPNVEGVATFEPVQFESWVLDRFRSAGYTVERTPTAHDAGVDGIARPPVESSLPTVLMQVKHTQLDQACREDAVLELANGESRYPVSGQRKLVVVTNAPRFTARAIELAGEHDVQLISRATLGRIERMFRGAL